MNRVLKKTLVLMTFLLTFGTMWGQTTFWVDSLQYQIISENTVKVAVAHTDIVNANIPSSVTYGGETYSVTEIGNFAFSNDGDDSTQLQTVTIPNSVTKIGLGAFYYCKELTSVVIPEGVNEIQGAAFYGCSKLASITIPNSVTSIGDAYTLSNYNGDTIYYGSFQGCTSLVTATLGTGITSISRNLFRGCSSLVSVTIPDGLTTIGNHAFYDCSSLTSITIPDNVTYIGNWAFRGCSSLTSINIPEGLTSINQATFVLCTGLTSVTIPSSVTFIDDRAFGWCSNLTSVTISGDVSSIEKQAFNYCSSLTSITIPESVTRIDTSAFQGCSSLTEITIPNSVTKLGAWAFQDCSSLTSVTIGTGLRNIEKSTFRHCTALTSITIPDNVWIISSWVFDSCINLTSITIGDGVQEIGDNVFYSVLGLQEVVCLAQNPPTLGSNVFNNQVDTLKVACEVVSDYQNSSWASNFSNITCEGIGQMTFWIDSIRYKIIADNTVKVYDTDSNIVIANIPESVTYNGVEYNVTKIGDMAFGYRVHLASVTIPNSVTSIGYGAFASCDSLASIDIPNSVTELGDYVFFNCSGLASIDIPNSVTELGNCAFFNCSGLASVTLSNSINDINYAAFAYCTNLTSITIPESVTYIGAYAFDSCINLSSVTIGNSVKNIASYTFRNCKSLTEITIPNSVTSIGYGAFAFCSDLASLTIGNGVTTIGNYAFNNCDNLTQVICLAQEPPTLLGNFGGYSDMTLIVPCNAFEAYQSSDWGNKFSTIIGGTVVGDLYYCFYDEDNTAAVMGIVDNTATTMDIPATVTYNGNTYNVTYIGDYAFAYNDSIVSVTIPKSVTTIGDEAFGWCDNLTQVICLAQEPPALLGNFGGYSGMTLIVPCNAFEAYQSSDWGNKFSKIIGGTVVGDLYYCFSDEDSTAVVTGIVDNTATTMDIPATVTYNGNTYNVTYIGDYAFAYCISLTSITIPEGVTAIGAGAFGVCSGLTSVTIPEGVTTIGDEAFAYCSSLTSVTLPTTITYIGDYAFRECTSSLEEVTCLAQVPPVVGHSLFEDTPGYRVLIVPCGTAVAYGNSEFAKNFGTIISGTTVGDLRYCFSDEDNTAEVSQIVDKTATTINIPATVTYNGNTYNVTSIGELVFKNCENLASITIPDGVTTIGGGAFYGCKSLTSIVIPEGVTAINSYWYEEESVCWDAETDDYFICIHNKCYGAFENCTSLASITIPESVTSIGELAFHNCENLTSITIPNTVTSIGGGAFNSCKSLTSIVIPEGITAINSYKEENSIYGAFALCESLTSITIPNSVTTIDDATFYNCKSLASIKLPNGVTSIGNYAFSGCSKLKKVNCLAEVPPAIGNETFANTPTNKTLTVPCNALADYQESDWDLHFTSIVCDNLCDKPTNLTVSNITESGATISWVGTADSYEIQLNEGNAETLTAKTKTYTDLKAGTFYLVKVRAVCGESKSDWAISSFTTTEQEIEDCNEPTELSVSNVTETGATVSWTGTATAYEVQLNDSEVETVTTTSKTYTDLTAATLYLVKVRSVCAESKSDWVVTAFTTNEEIEEGCGEPTNLTISGVTETEATITWEGTVDAYEIQLNDGEIETVTENTKTYTDLEPATFYFFKIRSVCGENLSQWVMIPFFETMKGESGLNDAEQTISITVYPNPIEANGNATINLQGLNGNTKLMLMDVNGRVLINEDLISGTETYEITTSNLSAGVYYLAIRTQNGVATEKLIVK